MPTVHTIRASALSSWQDCPRRGAAKLFRKELSAAGVSFPDKPTGIAAIIGTGAHAGAMHGCREKSEGALPSQSAMLDAAVASLRFEISGWVEYDDKARNKNAAEKQVKGIVNVFARDVLPIIEPAHVEERITATLTPEFEISGQPDLIEADATIRDAKTGKSGEGHHAQFGTYSLLRQANGFPAPPRIEVDWIPRNKDTHEVIHYDVATCEDIAKAAAQDVIRQYTVFKRTGQPAAFPVNPMSMMCGPKYCPAHGTEFCPIHKGDQL